VRLSLLRRSDTAAKRRHENHVPRPTDAEGTAVEFLSGAASASETAGRNPMLILLGVYADENAIARSRRSFHTVHFAGPWAQQASHDLAGVIRDRVKEGLPAQPDEAPRAAAATVSDSTR
jgi:hypothetical protein